jgi:MFS family permease
VEDAAWLNRSTVGVALASLFSDASHELGTAVLPAVLLTLGAGPAALGWIEGSADGLSSLAKLWGGVTTDRVARRKPLASIGYLVTAVGIAAIALCTSWYQVLACRVAAWIGRGSRSAPRDVLMAEATTPATTGKAFGMERAGDALGAVIGPLVAVALLARGVEARHVMFASLFPGLLAFLSIALLVRETPAALRPGRARSFFGSPRETGRPFRRYLVAILLFGSGDFSRTLLILYATQHLTGGLFSWKAGTLAIALYVLHNAVSSLAAFPIGALTDRVGRRPVLIAGYLFAAATAAGFFAAATLQLAGALALSASGETERASMGR